MNSLTSLLEITHKSLFRDLCFFLFFGSLCLFLLCPCTQSLSSPRAVCILLISGKQEGNLRRTIFPTVHRACHHTRALGLSLYSQGCTETFFCQLRAGRSVTLDMWNSTASQLQLLWTVWVTRLALHFSTDSCHSPPCLPDLGKSETQPRKEHGSKAWAWEQMLKKERKKKKKNKEILSWFVCFPIYTTVNKFRGLLVYNAFCGHVIQMWALI